MLPLLLRFALALACLAAAGTASARSCDGPGKHPRRTAMPIYYVTDRKPLQAPARPGRRWGPETDDRVHYGALATSILRSCATLAADYPSWWKAHEGETRHPRAYFLVHQDREIADGDSFTADMRTALDLLRADDAARPREVILYIHGYNNDFAEAARRAGQLAFDLGGRTLPLIYSWPSQHKLVAYPWDATRAQRSQPLIRDLIVRILDDLRPERFHIVAHSMGNRVTVASLIELAAARPDLRERITSLTLLAPDLDTWIFRRTAAARLEQIAERITLVTDRRDKALGLSERVNGASNLGTWDRARPPFVIKGMYTIDTSALKGSRPHHADFEVEPAIMREIEAGIAGIPIDRRRCLVPRTSPGSDAAYYTIDTKAPGCPSGAYPPP